MVVRKYGPYILVIIFLAILIISPLRAGAYSAIKIGDMPYVVNGVDYVQIAETEQVNYLDPELPPGTYYYCVKAKNESGISGASNIVSVSVLRPIAFTAIWEGNDINVEWNKGDQVIEGSKFQLWRMDSNINKWISVHEINDINSFTYIDTWVSQGMNYKYAIMSRGELGSWYEWVTVAESGWATGDRPYQAPGGLRVSSFTDTTALVTWLPISGATTYKVQISTDGGSTWQESSVESPSVTVPCPCMMRVKAGTHERSQWSGVLRVKK